MNIFLVTGMGSKIRYMEPEKAFEFTEICLANDETEVELLIRNKYEQEINYGDWDTVDEIDIKPALYWKNI